MPDAPVSPQSGREPAREPVAAARCVVLEHPIAQHALSGLRNRETDGHEFRAHCHQLLFLLVAEATRGLPLRNEEIETGQSSRPHMGRFLERLPVVLSIKSDGLGLLHQLAEFLPRASIGSISLGMTSDLQRPEARLHIAGGPCLADASVIVFEPIISSGHSATLALNALRRNGATQICLVSYVISAAGLERIQGAHPQVPIWCGAVDEGGDAKRSLLPGIWNFSARLYP